jgi:spore coat protein CotH
MQNTATQSDCEQTLGTGILYVLWASFCFNLIPCQATAGNLKAEDLFRQDHLLDIQIKMAPEDFQKLRSQSDRSNSGMAFLFGGEIPTERFSQFKADVSVDGTEIKEVGIRTKGFIGSLNPDRPSLKIKFDEYWKQSPVEGLDRITLNNNVQDESLASQYLTYKLFNKAGIPAPRVSFAKVTVNDEYLGVYSHVESVRSPFLKHHFGDDSGEFYEGTIADFYPKAVDRVEAKNKRTRKDRSKANKLAQLLETQETFNLTEVEKLVNIDQFIRFWAMENLIAFWDGYSNNQNNYFAYNNPKDENRFHFMPWGADGAFVDISGPFGRMRRGEGPKAIYSQGMLNNRLYQSKGVPARYKAVMEDLLENVWNESEIMEDIARIQKLTRDHLHEKQDGLEDSTEKVTELVQVRRSDIEEELKDWPIEIGEARIPLHTVQVGKLKGSFSTDWKSERMDSVLNRGETNVQLVLEGETITMKSIGVVAQPEEQRNFGRRRRGGSGNQPREPRSTLTFQGIRESDGYLMNITFVVANEDFTKSNDEGTPFQGMLMAINPENNGSRFGGFGMMPKSLIGKLTLKEASRKQDAPVVGEFDGIVQESRGGMFGGNRNRGGRGPSRGRPSER